MSAIYELKAVKANVMREKARLNKEFEKTILSDTIFNKHRDTKIAIKAKLDMLNKIESWIDAELKIAILMAETEL